MTARQLIRKLQALDKKYPRRQVVVDVESRNKDLDAEWTHRVVMDADLLTINRLEGDGDVAMKANGEEREFSTITLSIQ